MCDVLTGFQKYVNAKGMHFHNQYFAKLFNALYISKWGNLSIPLSLFQSKEAELPVCNRIGEKMSFPYMYEAHDDILAFLRSGTS